MNINLRDIKDRAKSLLEKSEPYVIRQTSGYDSAKNKIIVAGYPLDGVISATISSDTLTRQESGIDYQYTAIVEATNVRTLTVTVLPTANCLDIIRLLALRQLQNKGWFNISVHENDNIVNVYRGVILELPEIGMQQEASDRQIVFGIKTMFAGVSIISKPTETEAKTYSRYGVNPSESNIGDNDLIRESVGGVIPAWIDGEETQYDDSYDIDKEFPPQT